MASNHIFGDANERLEHARQIERDFYKERDKACSIIQEVLFLCNQTASFRMKKSVVRSIRRKKLQEQ